MKPVMTTESVAQMICGRQRPERRSMWLEGRRNMKNTHWIDPENLVALYDAYVVTSMKEQP